VSLIDGIDLKNRQLLYKLRTKNVSAIDTNRSNRKYFPTGLKKSEKLKRRTDRYLRTNGVSAIKWMDKKQVLVASNYFDSTVSDEVSQRSIDGSRKQVSCPFAIVQYNKCTGGVDLSDQKIKYCATD
jgi:hypothetical protein